VEQILWLWSLLPASVVSALINILIIVGIVGICSAWIGRWIPVFNIYAPTLKLIGIVCLVVGVFFKGGDSVDSVWRARVAALEEKIRVAEAKSAEINTVIETVYVDRVQVVTDTKVIVQNTIRKSANKIDRVCRVEPEVISILNQSAKTPVPGDKK
jgi:hypothetical protein